MGEESTHSQHCQAELNTFGVALECPPKNACQDVYENANIKRGKCWSEGLSDGEESWTLMELDCFVGTSIFPP